jgi:hypothetical protein
LIHAWDFIPSNHHTIKVAMGQIQDLVSKKIKLQVGGYEVCFERDINSRILGFLTKSTIRNFLANVGKELRRNEGFWHPKASPAVRSKP